MPSMSSTSPDKYSKSVSFTGSEKPSKSMSPAPSKTVGPAPSGLSGVAGSTPSGGMGGDVSASHTLRVMEAASGAGDAGDVSGRLPVDYVAAIALLFCAAVALLAHGLYVQYQTTRDVDAAVSADAP